MKAIAAARNDCSWDAGAPWARATAAPPAISRLAARARRRMCSEPLHDNRAIRRGLLPQLGAFLIFGAEIPGLGGFGIGKFEDDDTIGGLALHRLHLAVDDQWLHPRQGGAGPAARLLRPPRPRL